MHEHHTLANAYDVIIAGGGAAGLSAALTLGRARRRVLVIDSAEPRNRFAGHMHGVLGHDGLPPLELLAKGRRELENYGVTLTSGRVQDVADVVRGLQVTLADGTVEYTRSLLVASGIDDELPDLPGLAAHWGGAAFQCPYCHGWEVRDRRIGILATSDAAIHHALLLRQWTDKLTIFPVGTGGTDLVNRLSDRDAEAAEASDAHTRAQFLARGINLVTSPVDEVLASEGELSGLRTHDGTVHPVDALAVSPIPHPRDEFLHSLELSKTDLPGPFPGPFLSTDPMGLTSHPRIWAVGTIVQPWLNVPASTGQASMVAAFLNFALVEEDTLTALRTSKTPSHWPDVTEDGFWEATYADSPTRWSGRPNSSLVSYLSDLSTPAAAEVGSSASNRGRAADIGCGEGADAIWLAAHGWRTTGVEVSATAVGRARTAADAAGVADLVEFTDGGVLGVADAEFDLVTASYLHAPAQDHRESLLRIIGSLMSTGGHLFLLSHVLPDDTAPADPTTADAAELTGLGLEADQWTVVRAGLETRTELVPGGSVIASQDRVLLLQRR